MRSLGNRKIKVNDNKFYNLPEYWKFFRQNNFQIIAIQERRVLGKCQQKGKEFTTFFSGGEGKAEYGVGISVCHKWIDKIIHTELVNDRIMRIVIDLGVNSKFCIFSVYGPPEESSNNDKIKHMSAVFWNELQKQLKEVKTLYSDAMILIAGDFSARVGCMKEYLNDNTPLVGDKLNERKFFNRNGNGLLLFCQHNKLAVANTYYSYDKVGTGTWQNPNAGDIYEYALDHILIQQENLFKMVLEGGVVDDIGLPTDHRATKLLLKFSSSVCKHNNTKFTRGKIKFKTTGLWQID